MTTTMLLKAPCTVCGETMTCTGNCEVCGERAWTHAVNQHSGRSDDRSLPPAWYCGAVRCDPGGHVLVRRLRKG